MLTRIGIIVINMDYVYNILSKLEAFKATRGQGALEYIAIVVGLILLVAAGFAIAGGDIFDEAASFVEDVIGEAGSSS